MAAAIAVAILLYACGKPAPETFNFEEVPRQEVHDLSVLQSENGEATMRMRAPLMQKFEFTRDSMLQSYEFYPDGFYVDVYAENGQLETTIVSQQAKHITTQGKESWSAFGDVLVINHIKGEKLEPDTIYWNRAEKTIYTDRYVRLTSDSGLMQGYGMTSDERARNSVILRPFDSYAVDRDSNYFFVDSINLMGPQKK